MTAMETCLFSCLELNFAIFCIPRLSFNLEVLLIIEFEQIGGDLILTTANTNDML